MPPQLLWLGAGQLGQRLFDPPNVKGWEGGEAWITTSSLLARGNMAGMLLGVVHLEDVLKDENVALDGNGPSESEVEGGAIDDELAKRSKTDKKKAKPDLGPEMGALQRLTGEFYFPRINLSARLSRWGVAKDAEIVAALADELLPVPLSAESRVALLEFLATERTALSIREGKLLDARGKSEDLLRRLAHLILSLPEAQLG